MNTAGDPGPFSPLLQALPGCVALVAGDGRILDCNGGWSSFTEANPFVAGTGPGDDYRQHCQLLARSGDGNHALVAIGILSALKGGLRHLALEYPVPGREQARWYSLTATAWKAGDSALALVSHTDISERMQRERRWKRNEQLFKATTENALDLIAILHEGGRNAYLSPSYGKTLGYAAQEPGWNILDTVHAEDRERFEQNCRIALDAGMSPLFEYRAQHRQGGLLELEARAVSVENPGDDQPAVLLISRDISAKKAAEQERAQLEVELRHSQKLEAIGQLAAGIAHEINTPCQYLSDNMVFLGQSFQSLQTVLAALAADAGPAELKQKMQDEDIDYLLEEVPRAIAQCKHGLGRIGTIVRAMKAFGHPGSEAFIAVNLNQTLENAVVVSQSEWKYVAEIEVLLDSALGLVECVPGEMNQVFLNLIVNAAHAIGESMEGRAGADKGRITVSSTAKGDTVEVRVRDTGCGIPEAIRDQIFLPFFTTKAVGKGTGQGLSIVHSVIKKHGGSIDFESRPGAGTTFTVRLPMNQG